METEIYIKSKLFSTYPEEEDDINPGRFGKKLAEFTKSLLLKENIDREKNEFLISISPKEEFKRKLFKKISTKETVSEIYGIIKKGIVDNPEIEIM